MKRLWRTGRHAAVYCPCSLGNIYEQFSEVHVLCDVWPLRPLAHGQLITGQRICGKPETKIFPGLWGLFVLYMPSTTSQTVYTLTWPSADYKEFQGQSEVKTSGLSYFFPKASHWEYLWLSRILR